MRVFLILLLASRCCAAVPVETVLRFFDDQPAGAGTPSCGGFSFVFAAGNVGASGVVTNTAPTDPYACSLLVASTACQNADGGKMHFGTDTPPNTFHAGAQVPTGVVGLTNQMWYCTNATVTSSTHFWASSDAGGSIAFEVEGFSCTGTPAFDAEASGGTANSTSVQPGTITPNGTELDVTSVSFDSASGLSINSSFSTPDVPTGGGSPNQSYKQTTTSENPTWSSIASTHFASSMMAFKSSGCSAGGFTYTLVSHVSASFDSTGTATSSSIDTTGANLIVYVVSWGSGHISLSDNKGNSAPTGLGVYGDSVSHIRTNQIFYSVSPTVGTGHTFTISCPDGAGYCVLNVLAFNKSSGTPALDTSTGTPGAGSSISSATVGSITPAGNNELLVAGFGDNSASTISIDSGYTIAEQASTPSSGVVKGAGAYLIQTTATTKNPAFSISSSFDSYGLSHAAFK